MCAILAASIADFARAQVPQDPKAPQVPVCKVCRSTGTVPCSEHPKEDCEWEKTAQFCSVIADCPVCKGLGFVDCTDCDNAASDKQQAAKSQLIALLRPKVEQYDAQMSRKLRKAVSPHFTLVWEIESLKVEKRILGAHELLHLYLDRLEQHFALYVELTKAHPGDIAQRQKIFVWWLTSDQQEATLRFCQQGSPNGMKLMGSDSAYSVCGNRQFFTTDERLHRNLVHSVTHLLFAHETPSMWIGNQKAGWVEEGLAHVFEDRLFGICDNYCYEEQNTTTDFKSGRWRIAMRKLIVDEKAPAVSDVIQRNTDQLKLPEHLVAFSLVEYLLQLGPGKFDSFGKRLRNKTPVRDALDSVFKLTPLQLEAGWKAWVIETYPKQ
ncbi:MAG TPA: hypothetical protein VM509_02915 [Planctomycetota bacterium]|nr:hypothetical protein [Planctomycetota bacterium]